MQLLGLSLTANSVVWTLVDLKDGTIVADDVVEVDSAENVANAAAHSVEAFAIPTERDIDAIRIAWGEGTAGSAVKLTSKLRSLGFSDVDVISEDEARQSRNRTARYIDPPLELAYGAARTVTAEDHDRPLRRMAGWLPARRVSIGVASGVVVMVLGAAAAGYMLVGRAPLQAGDHASTPVASAPPPDDAPAVAVPSAALPPPPAPQAAVAPPVNDEPEVASVPGTARLTDTAPTPVQTTRMARQPHLTPGTLSAGSTTVPKTAPIPATTTAPAPAPAVTLFHQPRLTPEELSAGSTTVPETAPTPATATAPAPAPATTIAGQPHLTPEALSARLLPGPVPPMYVVGVPAPLAAPPRPPNPFDIFAALP